MKFATQVEQSYIELNAWEYRILCVADNEELAALIKHGWIPMSVSTVAEDYNEVSKFTAAVFYHVLAKRIKV